MKFLIIGRGANGKRVSEKIEVEEGEYGQVTTKTSWTEITSMIAYTEPVTGQLKLTHDKKKARKS